MHFEHTTFLRTHHFLVNMRIVNFMNITRYDIHVKYTCDVFKIQDDVFNIHLDVLFTKVYNVIKYGMCSKCVKCEVFKM